LLVDQSHRSDAALTISKNNLQVIYSLLNLQSRSLVDSTAQSVLRDSQSRIRAMALVHEQLYQSKDLAKIELADYAKSLAHSLLDTYRATNPNVSIQLDIEPQQLNIETALPCGLILTELISNALKYAFPEGRSGKITVISAASPEEQVMLMIQDDGIGLPSDFNLKTASSLGLRLVRNLAKQVKGEILILPEIAGTKFQLSFPMQA
ncbi:MAG: histidine kinase dimerization/phosphoacceptor domain -containing protein, partial [Cyanobacteria bacterium J06626_14]